MGQNSQATIQEKLSLKDTEGSLVPINHPPAYLEKEKYVGTVPKETDELWRRKKINLPTSAHLPLMNILAMCMCNPC